MGLGSTIERNRFPRSTWNCRNYFGSHPFRKRSRARNGRKPQKQQNQKRVLRQKSLRGRQQNRFQSRFILRQHAPGATKQKSISQRGASSTRTSMSQRTIKHATRWFESQARWAFQCWTLTATSSWVSTRKRLTSRLGKATFVTCSGWEEQSVRKDLYSH